MYKYFHAEELLVHVVTSDLAYYAFIKITLASQHLLFHVVCTSQKSSTFVDAFLVTSKNVKWYFLAHLINAYKLIAVVTDECQLEKVGEFQLVRMDYIFFRIK